MPSFQVFSWLLGICTQVFMLPQHTLHQQSHVLSPAPISSNISETCPLFLEVTMTGVSVRAPILEMFPGKDAAAADCAVHRLECLWE